MNGSRKPFEKFLNLLFPPPPPHTPTRTRKKSLLYYLLVFMQATDSIQILKDIPYGSLKYQSLDLYLPPLNPNFNSISSSLLVYVHGGAWRTGQKKVEKFISTSTPLIFCFNGWLDPIELNESFPITYAFPLSLYNP